MTFPGSWGSSGGSAAAVAAGEVWALGTDTGGSIRQPGLRSRWFKPTYGQVLLAGA